VFIRVHPWLKPARGMGTDISPMPVRHGQTPARHLHLPESEPLWRAGRGFVVRDLPWTVEKLRVIPPFEFENWAVIALGGIPNKVQVGDMGVDGRIFPVSSSAAPRKQQEWGARASRLPCSASRRTHSHRHSVRRDA